MTTDRTRPANGVCPPETLASLAGLKYVTDAMPGFGRRRAGRGFVYVTSRGHRVAKRSIIERIETLAIPPAWTDVWICQWATGHLQATGSDERRRKQYLYHARWREASDLIKFQKLIPFGNALPSLRAAVQRDLARRRLDHYRVAALLVELLDRTALRIGNEEYVRANRSFGLSTLRKRHVRIAGSQIMLAFRAKGGQTVRREVDDPRIARLVRSLQKLPGEELIQYAKRTPDGDSCVSMTSADVNLYIQEKTNQSFTAKDFRMWKASAIVAGHLWVNRDVRTVRKRTGVTAEAIQMAADALANTTTVCRKSYVHPALIDAYLRGEFRTMRPRLGSRRGLSKNETALLRVLSRIASRQKMRRV